MFWISVILPRHRYGLRQTKKKNKRGKFKDKGCNTKTVYDMTSDA